jgi:hypothetical protein
VSSSAVDYRGQKKVVTALGTSNGDVNAGGTRRDLVMGAWKGLAAKGRNDAQGVTQAALKSCVSCVHSRRAQEGGWI